MARYKLTTAEWMIIATPFGQQVSRRVEPPPSKWSDSKYECFL